MEFNVIYCKGMADIGGKIKLARKALGLTQEELAEEVGVETPSVSRWESGTSKPRAKNIPSLAKALKRPASWFLGEESAGLEAMQKRIVALEQRAPGELEVARLKKENEELRKIIASIPEEIYKSWPVAEPLAQILSLFYLSGDETVLKKLEPAIQHKRVKEYLKMGLSLRPSKNPSVRK